VTLEFMSVVLYDICNKVNPIKQKNNTTRGKPVRADTKGDFKEQGSKEIIVEVQIGIIIQPGIFLD